LRCIWYQWKEKDRAWANLDVPCDQEDRDLFNASTLVSVGNEKTVSFWQSSWLDGTAPKNIVPTLYKKTKRRNVKVNKVMEQNKWVDHVTQITSRQELTEYVALSEATRGIMLDI